MEVPLDQAAAAAAATDQAVRMMTISRIVEEEVDVDIDIAILIDLDCPH